ncbi:MAG TPA: glycosyltransferase [Thermoanaerobaculia bacterium]|nr:glycosyltransferase [Thermoanaerobaculia bacterium]
MRIFLSSSSRYPARLGGNGASRVHDNLAKGLAELGHTVYYSIREGYGAPLPAGVIAARLRKVRNAEIYHFGALPMDAAPQPGKPWVRTYHAPYDESVAPFLSGHFIFVSRAQAASFGSSRYVWNGIDPEEVIYSERKDDYFIFIVSRLDRAASKGLPIAIDTVERLGARLLVVAEVASGPVPASPNVNCLGYLVDEEKAEVLAGARALFFPVQIAEPFGLVAAEALMSGTPVIGSRLGSLPELITPDVGFTCSTIEEYVAATERVREIRPAACRSRAMREFHYRTMTRRYVAEYERARSF